MLFLRKVCKYEPLPVQGQGVGAAVCSELYSASGLQGLKKKMHLSVVAKGLVVTYTLHRCNYCFLIYDVSRSELNVQIKSAFYQVL